MTSAANTWTTLSYEEVTMNVPHADALVFFGATGDLAYKKIFPALQAMAKRGHLNVPVIGVAKAGWNLDQLRAGHATASRTTAASMLRLLTAVWLAALCGWRLQRRGHVSGPPYSARLGAAASALPRHPADAVRAGRGTTGQGRLRQHRRAGHYRKALGTDLASARQLNRTARSRRRRSSASIITWERPVHNMLFVRFANAFLSHSGTATMSRACRSPWRKTSGSRVEALLRGDGRHPRRDPESPVPGADQSGHGAAGQNRQRIDSG